MPSPARQRAEIAEASPFLNECTATQVVRLLKAHYEGRASKLRPAFLKSAQRECIDLNQLEDDAVAHIYWVVLNHKKSLERAEV